MLEITVISTKHDIILDVQDKGEQNFYPASSPQIRSDFENRQRDEEEYASNELDSTSADVCSTADDMGRNADPWPAHTHLFACIHTTCTGSRN